MALECLRCKVIKPRLNQRSLDVDLWMWISGPGGGSPASGGSRVLSGVLVWRRALSKKKTARRRIRDHPWIRGSRLFLGPVRWENSMPRGRLVVNGSCPRGGWFYLALSLSNVPLCLGHVHATEVCQARCPLAAPGRIPQWRGSRWLRSASRR